MFFWRRVASQIPEDGLNPTATPVYTGRVREINRRISQGKSFSGYERNALFLNLEGRGFADVGGLFGVDFEDDGRAVATVDWDLTGKHNRMNALAAIGAASHAGVEPEQAIAAWSAVPDDRWHEPAGTLEWSRFETADHTIDCVFSYAFFLASRVQDAYPAFGEVHAEDGATPHDLVDGLRAMTNLLAGAVTTAPPQTRSIIWRRPEVTTGAPNDFAARGAHELAVHTHDICAGTNVAFDPPRDVCQRLYWRPASRPGRQHPGERPWHPHRWSDR